MSAWEVFPLFFAALTVFLLYKVSPARRGTRKDRAGREDARTSALGREAGLATARLKADGLVATEGGPKKKR
jgi:hypothetical protein